MADWTNPRGLTTEELKGFLLDPSLRHRIGHRYNDGVGVVDELLREVARRLDCDGAKEGTDRHDRA